MCETAIERWSGMLSYLYFSWSSLLPSSNCFKYSQRFLERVPVAHCMAAGRLQAAIAAAAAFCCEQSLMRPTNCSRPCPAQHHHHD